MNVVLQEVQRLRSDLALKNKDSYESSSGRITTTATKAEETPAIILTESEKTQLALRLSTMNLPGAFSCPTEQVPKLVASHDRHDDIRRHNDSTLDLGLKYDCSTFVSLEHQPIEELQTNMRSYQKMTLKEDMDHINAKKRKRIICLRVSLVIFVLLFILLWVCFGVIKKNR
jgi:hypothetical protein